MGINRQENDTQVEYWNTTNQFRIHGVLFPSSEFDIINELIFLDWRRYLLIDALFR